VLGGVPVSRIIIATLAGTLLFVPAALARLPAPGAALTNPARADRLFDDWKIEFWEGCELHPAKEVALFARDLPDEHGDIYFFDAAFNSEFKILHISRNPTIKLWTAGHLGLGTLAISVDGHAFKTLHPERRQNNLAEDELPPGALEAMRTGTSIRILYQEQGVPQPQVRDQSLKGFGEAADFCIAHPDTQ
jgi:hypothetical protein